MFGSISKEDVERYTGSSTGSNLPNQNSSLKDLINNSTGSTGPTGSFTTSQIIEGICEGPIEGWPVANDPLKFIYLDGTPVKSYSNTINIGSIRAEFKNGTVDQSVLSQYNIIGSVKAPNWQAEIDDITKVGGSGPVIQQVQIRDDSDGAYPTVEAVAFTINFPEGLYKNSKKGGRTKTNCGIKIEINSRSDGSGAWINRANADLDQEVTSGGFDYTFVIEIPPGWGTAYSLQNYTNKVDDIIQFRITKYNTEPNNELAHTKIYLKNYSIYTRNQFSYPYTSLIGLTFDSKNFDGSIPSRMYELKLLKVKVPSNYTMTFNDKTGEILERKYTGTWDGTFTEGVWTDNPVWCFYDLVTNSRYGLGKYIDSTLLNKWKLYEIAKYCDATEVVGSDSIFSIPNSYGGVTALAGNNKIKEPRFTCNILISNREEAYSVVQRLASLFRSIVFFQQGTIQLIQDKPTTPTYLYNNTNVIGGTFSYASSSSKARHTVAIIKYIDPSDLYSEKLEYVEDYDGIARYGYREIEIDGFGCTSRGQARRIGRHIIITEKFELETISFKVGLEGGIVTPGALITIKDTYRQQYRAAGRVSSATTNSITLDSSLTIPAGATSILLWVETPTSLNETIESNTSNTYKPTLTSHAITATAGSTGLTSLTLTSGTFSTTPVNGNIWAVTYTPLLAQENNPATYKVIAVSENTSFEYEITALQHYSSKYDEIESYEPITEYKAQPFKLFVPPPTEGFISSTFNGISYDIKVTWRSDKEVAGTKYKIEVMSNNLNKILATGISDTTYILPNITSGIFYFKIYTLSNISSTEFSAPLILGPHKVKEIMSQNNFYTFYQSKFSDSYITNSWPDDTFSNNSLKYELWRGPESPNLLRSPTGYATIQSINSTTNTVTVLSSLNGNVASSPERHTAEVTIYPYTRYTTTNISVGTVIANTSTTLLVIDTLEKPNISIGDKVMNSTRNTVSNIRAITQVKTIKDRWVSQISITPAVASQVNGDFIYIYKGVIGSAFKEAQPSGVLKQKTFKALATTSTTNLAGSPDVLASVLTGDVVVNRTRSLASIVSATGSGFVTVTPAITAQAVGDTIAYYQNPAREVRPIKKYAIDWLNLAYGGDSLNILEYEDLNFIPKSNNSIMVNITLGKCAEVINSEILVGGILNIVTYPAMSGIADNNEVVFFNKDEVYTASRNIHIHPTSAVTTTGTNNTTVVTVATLFSTAVAGDLLINATRNTCSVILTVNSSTQVTLVGSAISPTLHIFGQIPGDVVFLVKGSSMTSFVQQISYTHPSIVTAIAGTSPTALICTGSPFTEVTTSYLLYNMTRNAYSSISAVSPNGITTSTPIINQAINDYAYTFLPSTVLPTEIEAPDGAFNYANPGDILYNVTKDTMSTIKDVVTLTGSLDKKVDRLILNNSITKQAGDEFRIIQGYITYPVVSATGTTLTFSSVANLELGDKISTYAYLAEKVGTTSSNTLTDTGLSPATVYRYWMRPVNSQTPSISGIWIPSTTTGDPADTTEIPQGNYETSNDNNGFPIAPNQITRLAPYIDLPPGGTNPDSTANIRLYWEWTGAPRSIDGFTIYFWSSNTNVDNNTIDADDDFASSIATYTARVNPRIKITGVTNNSTTPTITTAGPHKLSNGDKVRIGGVRTNNANTFMLYINNLGDSDYFTITYISDTTFSITTAGLTTAYFADTGTVTSCKYVYQINNLTANYYYNAWVQPYRKVNTTINEEGIIVGSPKRLYVGV